jgi:MFS transporter, DHA1 family, multidrug resistance protein
MLNAPPREPVAGEMRFGEFVALIALLMALTALSIDMMLPALPAIANDLGEAEANRQHLVIIAYVLGFAVGQPVHGPLSDRWGRRPLLVVGLLLFLLGTVAAMLAPGYTAFLVARGMQGFGAAAARVVAVAVVRDRFAGRAMARVMSFVTMVFIIAPILAPGIGELILLRASWPWIFAALLLAGLCALIWMLLRLPETRRIEDARSLSLSSLAGSLRLVLSQRQSVGYTIASGFLFGVLIGYLGSSQRIFVDIYDLGRLFPVVFGGLAAVMILAALTNAQLVGRLGMRRVSHFALLGYFAIGLAYLLLGFPAQPPLGVFLLFMAATFFCFGLVVPNFNAIAMEPLGRVAGMGSSFIGFYTNAAGAGLGWAVGHAFDLTVRPMAGSVALLGALAFVTVLITEKGVLFHGPGGKEERG